MTPIVVCDASAVVAMLLDAGPDRQWAAEVMRGADLAAPALMPFEVANVLRRHEAASLVGRDQAAQAHADLLDLTVYLWPHHLLAARAWELRADLSSSDASYVALGEALGATLATLDHRLSRAPGLRCAVATPDHGDPAPREARR